MKLNREEGIRAAFYVPWDAASFSSLREYAHQIDLLYPEWLHVLTPDGHLQGVDEQTNKFFDVIQDGSVHPVDDKVMPFLKAEDTGMEVFPLVNNFDGIGLDRHRRISERCRCARDLFRQQIERLPRQRQISRPDGGLRRLPHQGAAGYVALLHELV